MAKDAPAADSPLTPGLDSAEAGAIELFVYDEADQSGDTGGEPADR